MAVLQALSFLAVVWLIIGLVAMLVTIKAWSDFATGDFIFGMIFVINAGFFFVAVYTIHKIRVLMSGAREFENKVTVLKNIAIKQKKRINSLEAAFKKATSQPATNEPPAIPCGAYPDSYVQAEVEAAKERELDLPPDDGPAWKPWRPWEQHENDK